MSKYIALLILILFSFHIEAVELGIRPVQQNTPVWCWVAVGEMIFNYYDLPNVNPAGYYQCGIVGLLAVGSWRQDCYYRCQNCNVPAGQASTIVQMIQEYPQKVAAYTGKEVARLSARYVSSALTPTLLVSELDGDRPVIAGISPTPNPLQVSSQHVALIVGYKDEDDLLILVNDPYPFGAENPYYQAEAEPGELQGSYWIPYNEFRSRLNWRESITLRKVGSIAAREMGNYCCFNTPYGPNGCPLNLSGSLPRGAACTCTYPQGVIQGIVCKP